MPVGVLTPGRADDVGVDFRSVEVVEGTGAKTRGNRGVRRVLVGPSRVSASLMDDAEDAVGADELPRENRIAAIAGVAGKFLGVDGVQAAIGQGRAGSAAVEFRLVDIDAFFVLGRGAGRGCVGRAGAGGDTIAGRVGGAS